MRFSNSISYLSILCDPFGKNAIWNSTLHLCTHVVDTRNNSGLRVRSGRPYNYIHTTVVIVEKLKRLFMSYLWAFILHYFGMRKFCSVHSVRYEFEGTSVRVWRSTSLSQSSNHASKFYRGSPSSYESGNKKCSAMLKTFLCFCQLGA